MSLALANISYAYDRRRGPAIDGVDLEVPPGQTLAVLGPSGCGKTTLLKLVAGLLAPDSGDVRVDGRSVVHRPPEQRPMTMVFQQPLLFDHLSVFANVAFGPRMAGIGRAERNRRAAAALADVHMAEFADRRPATLSGGQQSRVALARSLVTRPRILLLDEPFAALDPALRSDMQKLLRRLDAEGEHSTLFVTHDQAEAVAVADRIAVILDGRLQMVDTPLACYQRPVSRAVAEFFGGVNFLEGDLAADGRLHTAAGPLQTNAAASDRPRTGVTATLRPAAIERDTAGVNALTMRVTEREFGGDLCRYRLESGSLTLYADWPYAPDLVGGSEVSVRLPSEYLWVLPRAR